MKKVAITTTPKDDFWEGKCAFCIIREEWDVNSENSKEGKFIQKDKFGAFVLAENENHLVMADKTPRTKAHLMVIPKKHQPTIEGIGVPDWNSLLPLLKKMIEKINKVYHPAGFMLYSYNGRESFSFQSVPHFHLHILPVYRKDYGHNWFATRVKRSEQGKKEELKPTSAEYQEVMEKLQVDNLNNKKGKVVANLVSQEKSLVQGHCIITSREYISSDIQKIDQEAWNQMGKLLQEYIKKTREKIEARNFIIHIPLGKMSGPQQEDVDEFQLHITPFKAEKLEYYVPGTSLKESARIAKKIMDPDNLEYSCKGRKEEYLIYHQSVGVQEWKERVDKLECKNAELQEQIKELKNENQQLKEGLTQEKFQIQVEVPPKNN